MENDLKKCINKLNKDINRIDDGENTTWIKLMILPLLQQGEINPLKLGELMKISKNSKIEIKKLESYKFSDFISISDKIEDYLPEFTEETHGLLPKNAIFKV